MEHFVLVKVNFNPHSREGSDECMPIYKIIGVGISIHTPAKGVTAKYLKEIGFDLFQSTLPRRE